MWVFMNLENVERRKILFLFKTLAKLCV